MPNELNQGVSSSVLKNIESVIQLEQQFERQRSPLDRFSDAVFRFAGSVSFIAAHVVLFSLWIAANRLLPQDQRFDPAFAFLEVWAALEALLLSAFVLMSQGRQRRQVDHWTHVILQVSLLAEQESTMSLQLLRHICKHLGLHQAVRDPQLQQLMQATELEALAGEVGKARQTEEDVLEAVTEAVEETATKESPGS